ncbi:MAG: thiamine pyrophosphate-binding protein [Candidatus Hydrogenedentes bacterium]|jgi:acetolactate synthase-1/2/3 large subunit|nr:thiamine pyrophosphate-binding protein [Candidatus Hydrogenedentota bacterium]
MGKIQAGKLAAKVLKQEGIDHIFTLTGGHIMPILRGCEDEGISVIDTRHEQAAVFMAEGGPG